MKIFKVIGLMSGTSLDGLDIVYAEFYQNPDWKYDMKCFETVRYDKEMKEKLSGAYRSSGLELTKTDLEFGRWTGKKVKEFIKKHTISPDLVVSHGHTVFHDPAIGLTLQIGNGFQIMKACGVRVVNDLRTLDVLLGGQGAPLVPLGDKILFADYDYCLNLGGFSNISYDRKGERIAFDICPVNIVLNHLAGTVGSEYDRGGEISGSGSFLPELFDRLNRLEYYGQMPPKSLGIEWVERHIFPLLKDSRTEDLMHTFTHHAAFQISEVIKMSNTASQKVLITGGGAKNDYLLQQLKRYSGDTIRLTIPSEPLIDYKEALIFGFLGLLRWLGKPNTLKSVTGANIDSSGGVLFDNIFQG